MIKLNLSQIYSQSAYDEEQRYLPFFSFRIINIYCSNHCKVIKDCEVIAWGKLWDYTNYSR
ncbi:hypothetical protein Patl1_00957 [Pistacia atlantica]|uniref:Uncharacterized protein n=1 Tax=Pistacia atlantica TaxID=434234 RepID=A0ACC1CCM4_9ROSI|nr:hypothetical protein Patl1_00957 [Pistacia atlantica]